MVGGLVMILEEAIKHCEKKSCGKNQCALEHKQLAEWLMELKAYREEYGRLNNDNKKEGEDLLYTANKVAERTKKEMIDKACEWLEEHLYEEMFDLPFNNWIELFKKAMEERQ